MPTVPRLNPLLASGFAALALAGGAAGGCGGGSSSSSSSTTSTGATNQKKPPASAERPPPRLKSSDRKAYAAIQKASGDLRAAVTPLSYGTATTIDTAALATDVRKLNAVAPHSASLQGLRQQTLSEIGRASCRERV